MIDSLNIRRIIYTFFPCLQGIKMRRTKREGQKTDVCSDKKKIDTTVREKKFTALFVILLKKILV